MGERKVPAPFGLVEEGAGERVTNGTNHIGPGNFSLGIKLTWKNGLRFCSIFQEARWGLNSDIWKEPIAVIQVIIFEFWLQTDISVRFHEFILQCKTHIQKRCSLYLPASIINPGCLCSITLFLYVAIKELENNFYRCVYMRCYVVIATNYCVVAHYYGDVAPPGTNHDAGFCTHNANYCTVI